MAKKNAKPPVKPIGRILYSEYIRDHWFHEKPGNAGKSQPEASYDRVCDCKGFSDDRPFSVFFHKVEKDKKPFKVVFHWTNSNYKSFTFKYMGSPRSEMDGDTYHMMDVLEEHATKTAAQKAMRKYAEAAFAKVDAATPERAGDLCNCTHGEKGKLRIGDLIQYTSCPGIIWKIIGERRTNRDWSLKVEPIFSFLVDNGTNKVKEIAQRDVYNYVHPLDIVELGTAYTKLGLAIQDEAKRRSA